MPPCSLGALALALAAAGALQRIELDIFLRSDGNTQDCHQMPAGSQPRLGDPDTNCGARVNGDSDGRGAPLGHWIANGNNFLFVRTVMDANHLVHDAGTDVRRGSSVSLLINADTTDRDELDAEYVLCEFLAVTRTDFSDGERRVLLRGDGDDRFQLKNVATLRAGNEGNLLTVTPFARAKARAAGRAAPLPRMRVVVIPLVTEKQWTPLEECSSVATAALKSTLGGVEYDPVSGSRVAEGEEEFGGNCYKTNVTLQRGKPYFFTVNVSTEPRLEPSYPEISRSCHHAEIIAQTTSDRPHLTAAEELTEAGARRRLSHDVGRETHGVSAQGATGWWAGVWSRSSGRTAGARRAGQGGD